MSKKALVLAALLVCVVLCLPAYAGPKTAPAAPAAAAAPSAGSGSGTFAHAWTSYNEKEKRSFLFGLATAVRIMCTDISSMQKDAKGPAIEANFRECFNSYAGMEPERLAFVQRRIAELKARIGEGGPREAALRALLHVGAADKGADERAFNELRQIRAENKGLPLAEFKQLVREQYFSLLLDREAALAAIPKMLPPDAAGRRKVLDVVRRVAEAAGPVTGERATRLAQIEKLFAVGATTKATPRAAPKARRAAPAARRRA